MKAVIFLVAGLAVAHGNIHCTLCWRFCHFVTILGFFFPNPFEWFKKEGKDNKVGPFGPEPFGPEPMLYNGTFGNETRGGRSSEERNSSEEDKSGEDKGKNKKDERKLMELLKGLFGFFLKDDKGPKEPEDRPKPPVGPTDEGRKEQPNPPKLGGGDNVMAPPPMPKENGGMNPPPLPEQPKISE